MTCAVDSDKLRSMDLFNQNVFLKENSTWILFLVLVVGSFFAYPAIKKILESVRKTIHSRAQNSFASVLTDLRLERPLAGLVLTTIWHSSIHIIEVSPKFEKFLLTGISLFQAIFIIMFAYLASEAVGEWLRRAAAKTETTLDDQLVPLARKTLKVLVVVLGTLITLDNLGLKVMPILAGLGLGGLALALAAQDTAANIFGSIVILADQTFKVGDHIKIGDTEGIVEDIGFRSTQIRTPYRSVVTLPNSTMAKEKIDNMSARTAVRIRHVLGITYDTSTERIEALIEALRHMLSLHPKVLKDDIRVFFNNMGDFNLQILVHFFIQAGDPIHELEVQQDILLEIMRIAQKLNVGFAFPTQTLHVESLPKA